MTQHLPTSQCLAEHRLTPILRNLRRLPALGSTLAAAAMLVALSALGTLPGSAWAQSPSDWPQRPVRVVAADSAGGVADAMIRSFADRLQQKLGQSFVAEFRPGAGGTIAGAAAARATPDGYTILLTTLSVSGLAPWIYKAPNYDAMNDFAAVARVAEVPSVLYVKGDSRFKTMAEFLQFAKANPGKSNLSVVGLGSSNHLTGVLIERAAGAKFTYVPFKSGAESMQSVLGGTTDISVSNISTVIGQFKSGALRALATTGRRRAEQLPDLPTLQEAGMADLDVTSWYGLLAPARTPRPIIDKLGAAMGEILAEPEVIERYRRIGAEVSYMRPADFDAWLRKEQTRWKPVVEAAGMLNSQ